MPKPESKLPVEVVADPSNDKRQRRRFTGEQKLNLLREADKCHERGELAALLRREGLYSQQLAAWREQLERAGVEGLAPQKTGKKPRLDEKDKRIAKLEREKVKLEKEVELQRKLLELQRKAHEILGLALPRIEEE